MLRFSETGIENAPDHPGPMCYGAAILAAPSISVARNPSYNHTTSLAGRNVSKEQLLPPEEERHSSDNSDEQQVTREGSVALGLIPAPEMPHRLAQELSTKLPQLLSRRVDADVPAKEE